MSFVTLHTGLSGVRAAQTGVDITSHNISNAGTAGYTRQRVEQTARAPYEAYDGLVGTGVEVEDIVRLRDMFLDNRVRSAVSSFAEHDTRAANLERLEIVYGEPDSGITPRMNELWAAFEDLALDPANPATRTVVLNQLDSVASRIRDVSAGTQELYDDAVGQRDELLTEAQDLIDQIVAINEQVSNAPRDQISNTLLDDRDVMVDRLASLLGATATLENDNTYTITVGSEVITQGLTGATLSLSGDDLQVDGVTVPTNDHGGEFAGVQRFITEDVPTVRARLEDVATQFADSINAQNAAGFTTSGAAGGPLLSYTAGDVAATIAIATTNNADIATAGSATAGIHDATNAIALADLRTADRGDGLTHDQALRDAVVALGAQVASIGRTADSAAEIATTAEVNRTSMHGVSLDEEMVALVQYQRALEASSRVMTAADEMLDVIINRTGIVGR